MAITNIADNALLLDKLYTNRCAGRYGLLLRSIPKNQPTPLQGGLYHSGVKGWGQYVGTYTAWGREQHRLVGRR